MKDSVFFKYHCCDFSKSYAVELYLNFGKYIIYGALGYFLSFLVLLKGWLFACVVSTASWLHAFATVFVLPEDSDSFCTIR